jgi:hypothetical protein
MNSEQIGHVFVLYICDARTGPVQHVVFVQIVATLNVALAESSVFESIVFTACHGNSPW